MKKIKHLVYIAFLSLLAISCEDNTESVTNPGEFSGESIKEIKVSFTDSNMSPTLTEGETTSFRVEMPQIINGEVKIYLDVTSSDGNAEVTYPSTITLQNGERAKYFDVTPTDDGVVETETFTVKIKDVRVELNTNDQFFVHTGDDMRSITVKDVPTPIVTTVGDLTFNFSWSGTNDLDCRLLDSPPTTIYDTGYSTTPGESVTLGAAVPDGDYLFTVRPWTVNDASIDYDIEVVAQTESRTYSGNFMNLQGNWTMELIVLEINKSTNGTVVTYMINQL